MPAGAYHFVTRALRRAFRSDDENHPQLQLPVDPPKQHRANAVPSGSARRTSKWPGTTSRLQMPRRGRPDILTRRGTVAIHVRRGDRVGRGATSKYPTALVRTFAALSSRALLGTGLFQGVDVAIYTEPGNSSELFELGCPSLGDPAKSGAMNELISCRVTSGSVLHDLRKLVAADVLGLSSSSFSVLAYYLRDVTQPALSPVRAVAQFFGATDGSDGRSANSSRAAARRESMAPPPSNLIFIHQFLQQSVSAGEQLGSGGNTLSSSTDLLGNRLLFMLKQLTKDLQRLLQRPSRT